MDTAYVSGTKAEQGGWAALVRGKNNYEIADHFTCATSYEAELCAVYKALETSGTKISIVSSNRDIVTHLHQLLDQGESWTPPENNKSLWMKVAYEAKDKLAAVSLESTAPELHVAKVMAKAQSNLKER